jgi:hypothetical protein
LFESWKTAEWTPEMLIALNHLMESSEQLQSVLDGFPTVESHTAVMEEAPVTTPGKSDLVS